MLDKKYIRYFISGYLNMYYSNRAFAYDPEKESYSQFKIRSVLRYAGLKDTSRDISWMAPALSMIEALFSSLLVIVRFFIVLAKSLITKKRQYQRRTFLASLIFASFRLNKLLESVRPKEISTLKIPFIKNDYSENEVDILTVIRPGDIWKSLGASLRTIWLLYRKYRRRDPLFRSFSSFEYYLTCCFVARTEKNNRFLYYNTYDRWAFLMCNTNESIFVQHGKLMDTLRFIKVGTPHTAYYLSKRQAKILNQVLFKTTPPDMRFRKPMEFTCNDLLKDNDMKNVLLVCWNNNIVNERKICSLLDHKVNMYIKPHPGDKDNPAYPEMAKQYDCTIVPKTGYPHVDVVVSYDSTLADEYEDVGVRVIRYDLLKDLNELKALI